jgi:hypothetical protein
MTARIADSVAPAAGAVVAGPEPCLRPRPVRARRGQDLSRPPLQAVAGGRAVSCADGFSRLRTSHADREQAIEVLKAAFMQGRLSKDEFDVRVGRVLASRMYAELDAVTADIPAGVAAVPWPRTRARAWALKPAPSAANVTAWGAGVSAALAVPLGIIAVLTRHAALLELSCVAFSGAAAVAWDAMVRLAGRASLGAADALGRQHKDAIGQCERGPAGQERTNGPLQAIRSASVRVLPERGADTITAHASWPSPPAARDGCRRASRPTTGRWTTRSAPWDAITGTPCRR